MAATYGFSRATVTVKPPGADADATTVVHDKIAVLVRGGRGRIRTRMGKLITDKPGVLKSERVAANHWLTTFVDGETWEVIVDKEGCSTC